MSCSGSSRTPRPMLVCGKSPASPLATADRSDCAAPMPISGFIRPTTCSMYCPRTRGGMLTSDRIAHTLVRPRISKVFGAIPTTLHRIPSILISCPTMAGSRLNRDSHNDSLITITLRRFSSSSRENVRPAIGLTPSTSKMPAVTHWRDTVSALPSRPAITMPPTFGTKPAIFSNVRLRPFQSSMFSGDAKLLGFASVVSQIVTSRSGLA